MSNEQETFQVAKIANNTMIVSQRYLFHVVNLFLLSYIDCKLDCCN